MMLEASNENDYRRPPIVYSFVIPGAFVSVMIVGRSSAPLRRMLRIGLLLAALAGGRAEAALPGVGVTLNAEGDRALVVHKNEVLLVQLPRTLEGPGAPAAQVLRRFAVPDLIAEPALSIEGTAVALLSRKPSTGQTTLLVWRTGQRQPITASASGVLPQPQVHVAISDDGRLVALTQRGRVTLVPVGGGRARLAYDNPGTYAVSSELRGGGAGTRLVVRVAEPTPLEAQWAYLDIRDGQGRPLFKTAKAPAGTWPAISPRGDLVGQPVAGAVEVYAPKRGALVYKVGLVDPAAVGARFSRDGRWAVTYGRLSEQRVVRRYRVPEGTPQGQVTVAQRRRTWQALRDDGTLLELNVSTPPPVSLPGQQGAPGTCRMPPARGRCAVVLEEPELRLELSTLSFE
jgi:hypothetical protein